MELRRLVDAAGLSFRTLEESTSAARSDSGESCFYSKSQWGRWLNGQSRPPRKAVRKLAEKLEEEDIDAEHLVDLWGRAFVPTPCPEALGAAVTPVTPEESYPADATAMALNIPWAGQRLVPAQLPPDVSAFTGRESELSELEALAAGAAGGVVVISAIDGTAGAGKTALAVHFAHHIASQCPDGQLYVNLRGFDRHREPMATHEALGGFLRALGVDPRQIPPDTAEQVGMYRTLAAGRRLLIVLDNAASPGQVRPLLPGTSASMVLVTSRNRLAGLVARDGARRLTLGSLPHNDAIALLTRIIGRERVAEEREAVASLARLCGYLPLALRIAAEYSVAHPRTTLPDLTRRLETEHERLDTLDTNDDESTSMRVVFDSSYQSLASDVARAFRLLGLHAGPDISVYAAAALLGSATEHARRQLQALTGRHLLEETGPDRYRFHDLLRLYASELASEEEDEAVRAAAIQRVLSWYLRTAVASDTMLIPERLRPPRDQLEPTGPDVRFSGRADALDWCEAECPNLIAATRQAEEVGRPDIAWKLPIALTGFFYLHKHWTDQAAAYEVGLRAARRAGSMHGETWTLISLGVTFRELGKFDEALQYFDTAIATARELGEKWAEGYGETNLGDIYQSLEHFDAAVAHYQTALNIACKIKKETGQDPGGDITLTSLADTYRKMHRLDDALDCSRQALAISHEIGDLWGEGFAQHIIGVTLRDLRQFEKAIDHLQQGLAVRREIGDKHGQAKILASLGNALSDNGQIGEAEIAWSDAISIFSDLGDSRSAESLSIELRRLRR